MKNNKITRIYTTLGKVLCGGAAGILGFIIGGPIFILPAALIGVVGSHFIEKMILSPSH